MTADELRTWVEGYRRAWASNDPADVAALFTEDALYYTEPYRDAWHGHGEIVSGWLSHRDEPGDAEFRFEILAACDEVGFVRGWTAYFTPPPREYSNLWVVRLAGDGRAREFTEWWLENR